MKKLILILFLFLAGNVGAADSLGTFGNYDAQVRSNLGLAATNTSFVTDTVINQFVREGVVGILPLIKGEKREFVITTIHKQNTYATDSLMLDPISVEWSKGDSVKSLTYAPRGTWYQLEVEKNLLLKKDYRRRPSHFDFTEDNIFLCPTPVVVGDTIKIIASAKLANIAAADSLISIPTKYRTMICDYATYRVALMRHSPKLSECKWKLIFSLISNGVDPKMLGLAQ